MKLRRPPLSPHSYLYHLEPLGQGTPCIESLTGYISRLAASHSVSTTALYGYVVAPIINKRYMLNVGSKYGSGVLGGHIRGLIKAINGVGNTATDHVKALEKLTLRQDLIYLTLLPWGEVLSELRLSRSFRVWCPECFEERRCAGQSVYEQLLWTLEVIELCPSHKVTLESTCPHCMRDNLPLLASGTRPGYCSNCRQWLGRNKSNGDSYEVEHNKNIERQLFTASSCGELLSSAANLSQFPKRITVATAVYKCISYFACGGVNDLAKAIGISGKTISNWRSGRNVPQLEFLILFCQRLGLTLPDILIGRLNPSDRIIKPAQDMPEARGIQKFIPYDEDKVRRQLEEALLRIPVPSLRTLSREVGINGKKLKHHFPELCRAIVEKYRNQHGNHWTGIGKAMDACLKENPPPSVLALARRLGHAKSTLYQRLPDKCHKIAQRFLQYQRIQSVRAREAYIAEIRAVALKLYKDGVYPSGRAVSVRLLKPGRMSSTVARVTLRGIRAELYGKEDGIIHQ